jgi:hypothetical protein
MGKGSCSESNKIPQSVDTPTQTYMSSSPSSATKYQISDDQKQTNKRFCIKSLINFLIYVICILSLSISLYLSYRHQQLEYNVKSLMYLDNKVMRIESDLNELIQKTNRLYSTTSSSSLTTINHTDDDDNDDDDDDDDDNNNDSIIRRDSFTINNGELDANSNSNNNNDGSIIVNKLPIHVFSEITRLKRDVSSLKMARRQRQTGMQQSPNENCLCPAGES